jgi:hypothetical protein
MAIFMFTQMICRISMIPLTMTHHNLQSRERQLSLTHLVIGDYTLWLFEQLQEILFGEARILYYLHKQPSADFLSSMNRDDGDSTVQSVS